MSPKTTPSAASERSSRRRWLPGEGRAALEEGSPPAGDDAEGLGFRIGTVAISPRADGRRSVDASFGEAGTRSFSRRGSGAGFLALGVALARLAVGLEPPSAPGAAGTARPKAISAQSRGRLEMANSDPPLPRHSAGAFSNGQRTGGEHNARTPPSVKRPEAEAPAPGTPICAVKSCDVVLWLDRFSPPHVAPPSRRRSAFLVVRCCRSRS
jgi:hypothetical protein